MVTSRRILRSNQRRLTLRSSQNKTNQSSTSTQQQRKRKIDLSVYDTKLTNLTKRRKKKKKGNKKDQNQNVEPVAVGQDQTPPPNEKRPIHEATKAAINSIGKISWYEHESNFESNINTYESSNDGDSSFQLSSLPNYADRAIHISATQERNLNSDKASTSNVDDSSFVITNEEAVSVNEELTLDGVNTTTHSEAVSVERLRDLVKFFALSKYTNTNIPNVNQRENIDNLSEINKRKWTQMVNVSVQCLNQLVDIMCPGPSMTKLKKDIGIKLVKDSKDEVEDDTTDYETLMTGMLKDMFLMMKNAKNGSIEKRVIKAILCNTMRRKYVQKFCKEYNCEDLTTGNTKIISKADYKNLMDGFAIKERKQSRARVEETLIKEAVSFILHKEHVFTTSWGDKVFQLGTDTDETIILPKLCRKISPKDLWSSYVSKSNSTGSKKLGRSTFYYIVRDLTTTSKEIVRSIDYVQALLVTEPIEVLQEIINTLVHPSQKETLSEYLSAMSTFLKYRYNLHVLETSDDCSSHDLRYALGRKSIFEHNDFKEKQGVTCNKCRFPFYVCNKIKNVIANMNDDEPHIPTHSILCEQTEDAIKVINESAKKFQLFMAHKARCTNQNLAISEIEKDMKRKCLEGNNNDTHAIMIGDYKMKFESLSSQETTYDHY